LHCLLDARARSAVLNAPMRSAVRAESCGRVDGVDLGGAVTGDPSDRSLKTEQ